MYNSTKINHGKYSIVTYLQRAFGLCSPKEFHLFRKQYFPQINCILSFLMLLDYYVCLMRYGAIVSDYFEYEFWKKRHCVRKEYVTMLFSRKIQNKYNHGNLEVFIDKLMFNERYKDLRTITSFDFHDSYENFLTFINKCGGKIIMKPLMGASGMGIFKPDVSNDEKIKNLYEKAKAKGNYFAEQLFVQTGSLYNVNPTSVNTVRIFSLFDGNDVYLMAAGVRIGGGIDVVDNLHAGGMVAEIDIETGKVLGPAYNLYGSRFIRHPKTKAFIPGLVIPNWNKVLEMVKEAALLTPNIGHAAWDIAVSDTEICFIEANEQGNFNLIQCCSQRGCKTMYENAMNGNTEGLFKL